MKLRRFNYLFFLGVLGKTLFADVKGEKEFQKKLKDGTILCALMNKVKPGAIKKYCENPKQPFQMRENIEFFNIALREYGGVPDEYIFVTTDLFEGKNMAGVLTGLRAFADAANAKGVKPVLDLEYIKS